jgi:hypothetical protein
MREGKMGLADAGPDRATAGPVVPIRGTTVTSYRDHLAAIEVANQGFAFPGEDALDERRRARTSFQSERAGGHSIRLLAVDRGRAVVAGRAKCSPLGLYLGGETTIPWERRGAMSAVVARAWEEAVDRGMPMLVTLGGGDGHRGLAAHRLPCGRPGVAPGRPDRPLSLLWTRIQRSARRAAQGPGLPAGLKVNAARGARRGLPQPLHRQGKADRDPTGGCPDPWMLTVSAASNEHGRRPDRRSSGLARGRGPRSRRTVPVLWQPVRLADRARPGHADTYGLVHTDTVGGIYAVVSRWAATSRSPVHGGQPTPGQSGSDAPARAEASRGWSGPAAVARDRRRWLGLGPAASCCLAVP